MTLIETLSAEGDYIALSLAQKDVDAAEIGVKVKKDLDAKAKSIDQRKPVIEDAMDRAVGLERLSPLADVAVGGLLLGTLLTLIFIPIFAYSFDRQK